MEPITGQAGGCTVSLYAGARPAVVYCTLFEQEAAQIWALLREPKPALAAICGVDWNSDLSPWPAPAAFRGGGAFGGRADSYLRRLTQEIVPAAERALGIQPQTRCLAGYSLAGLFALWGGSRCTLFDGAASISGSLWFDGFADSLKPPFGGLRRVYLSLGDRERRTKNPRMAAVEDCTRRVADIFRDAGMQIAFEMNPGGHFQDVPARIARGIDAIVRPGGGDEP